MRFGLPVAFEPPVCAEVWDPTHPPAIASQQVINTIAYLDSVGYFSGGNGPALGGTVPWQVYEQIAMVSAFGYLDGSATSADLQCIATLQVASETSIAASVMGPVIATDITQGYPFSWYNVSSYLDSHEFVERRMCPCYNRIPRELMEHLNCRSSPGAASYSQQYAMCQSTDYTSVYTTTGMNPLAAEMPPGRDAAAMADWQGCHYARAGVFRYSNNLETRADAPGWPSLFVPWGPERCANQTDGSRYTFYTDPDCHPGIVERYAARNLAYDAAVDEFGLAPSVHPQITVDFNYLDAVAGTCTPVGANGRLPDPGPC